MPMYTFQCLHCWFPTEAEPFSKIVPISKRDDQSCEVCGEPLKRLIDAPGSVWSPTRNGGHS